MCKRRVHLQHHRGGNPESTIKKHNNPKKLDRDIQTTKYRHRVDLPSITNGTIVRIVFGIHVVTIVAIATALPFQNDARTSPNSMRDR